MNKKIKNNKRKSDLRYISRQMLIILIAFVLLFTMTYSVYAKPSDDSGNDEINNLARERDENQEKLDQVNASLEELAQASSENQDELDEADAALVQIIAELDVIEEQIADKEAEIVIASKSYNDAVEKEKNQYDAMKVRIQYLYEIGRVDLISLYIESGNLSDTLTKADYIESLYEFDRNMLVDYQDTVSEVASLKSDLEKEKEELELMQSDYELEQKNMQSVVDELKSISDTYAVEISAAKNKAASYANEIKKQNNEIKKLEEEKARKEKAERERKEKEKREVEKKKKKEALQKEQNKGKVSENDSNDVSDNSNENTIDSDDSKSDDTSNNDQNDSDSNADNNENMPNPDEDGDGKVNNENNNSSYDVSSIYAAKGSETGKNIAAYACKFIGNPYVPGGTSLTEGADCSGFVYAVYKDFGYSVPRTSYALRSAGKEVSYEDAEPGDIICYAGHVAIYLGNGMIVHASTQKTGIKVSIAKYREILCVRRIV